MAKSMSPVKKALPWAIGLLGGTAFILLMTIRLGVWPERPYGPQIPAAGTAEKELWMEIWRHDKKIGYTHRFLKKKDDGFSLLENTWMRLAIMGMPQDMTIKTKAFLKEDRSLSSFSFDLASGSIDFSISGNVENDVLKISAEERQTEIRLKEPIFLLSSISDPVALKKIPPGTTQTFPVFDPSTLGQRPVRITREGRETLQVRGHPVETERFSIEVMGIVQSTWISDAGETLQETGPLGIRLIVSDRQNSMAGFTDSPVPDLTESFSIPANIPVENQENLTRLKLEIHGANDRFFLNGGRQTLEGPILIITREDPSTFLDNEPPVDAEEFLRPSPMIRADHPSIRKTVEQIVAPTDRALDKASKIMNWMTSHIAKRPVLSFPDAVKTLETRMGDCNEHAALFAALARAAGVPTRVETGLVHLDGRFYYHAWNVIYVGGWITIDSSMGQLPADPTHIRLIRGDIAEQFELIHAIDKITLKIMELDHDLPH